MESDTRKELLKALQLIQQAGTSADPTKYRYVIYARKSTDDEEKQERSLPDQVHACQEYADNLDLEVVEIVQEAESAKTSDTRPRFREVLKNIAEHGKYDGIIAWHPDRLARNMKDAGEIIDLLDKSIIKDLRFPSFTFENTASGKMLLGITFVLSKQYSDKLSDDVSRGNKHSIEEGRYVNKAKHGYYKDTEKRLQPDGENFVYIKKAFRMRLENKTLDEIAAYLNSSGYTKWTKTGSHIAYRWDKQKVQKLMRDTTYTGVIVYGKRGGSVDLTDKYDFEPAVSVDDFMRINKLDQKSEFFKLARKFRKGEDVKANLMRGMVICAECGDTMAATITTKPKQNKSYFYFRCENDECTRKPRSVRAKVVIDAIRAFLEQKPFSSQRAYDHYVKEMELVSDERTRQANTNLLAFRLKKSKFETRLARAKNLLFDEKDETIQATLKEDLKALGIEIRGIDAEIEKTEATIKAGKTAILNYEKFLELMEKLPKTIGSIKNMAELDFVIRKVFSNFTVHTKSVENITLSTPFDALCDPKVATSGQRETRTPMSCDTSS
ncbi:MAG: hypothetical protein RLZZ342_89 [Candidatus Parcubacteria bacterium]